MRLTADLRDAIFQQAIEGKLSFHLSSDTSIQDSFIHSKKKTIKAPIKTILDEIQNASNELHIPTWWKKYRLNDIVISVSDGDHQPPPQTENGVPFVVISNISDGKIDLTSTRHVPQEYYNNLSYDRKAQNGDILFSVTGSYGVVIVVRNQPDFCFQRHIALIKTYSNITNPDYLAIVLKSPYIKKLCDRVATGIAQKTVGIKTLQNIYIPIPPIEEQQRIVDRVNEIMPLIEEYGQIENQLVKLKKDFPQKMRSAILLAALQGKLTEHMNTDDSIENLIRVLSEEKGDFKNKRKARHGVNIEEIDADEIPFDLPMTWRFVRIIDTVKDIIAGGDKPKVFSKTKTEKCSVEVISNGIINNGVFGYTDSAVITEKSLTVSARGTIGYSAIRSEPYVPIVRLLVLLPLPHTNLEYLSYVLEGMLELGSGTAVKQLTVPMISPKIIPLPPLAEQQRIVDRLNEILPLCDALAEKI